MVLQWSLSILSLLMIEMKSTPNFIIIKFTDDRNERYTKLYHY